MHKHIDWDDPGADSVAAHYAKGPNAKDPNATFEPVTGAILSARYQGRIARVRVQAYRDDTSIGEVAALIDPATGQRLQSFGKLAVGDTVRLPDAKRAFEPTIAEDNDEED